MKRFFTLLTAGLLATSATQLQAQFGGGGMSGSPDSPTISGEMLKLFGDHKAFSADLEFQVREDGKGTPQTMPGKVAFADGKTRFEVDITKGKLDQVPPQAIAQLKQMGMDKAIIISLPKKALSYLIYPALQSYVELPISDPDAKTTADDFEMTITEIGKEQIGDHKCIKNKVVVTGKDGEKHDSVVWNATELKKFPVKIETTEEGHNIVLLFSGVKLSRPAASQFSPDSSYTKYDNIMGMMQEIMIKRMGGGAAAPTGQ